MKDAISVRVGVVIIHLLASGALSKQKYTYTEKFCKMTINNIDDIHVLHMTYISSINECTVNSLLVMHNHTRVH